MQFLSFISNRYYELYRFANYWIADFTKSTVQYKLFKRVNINTVATLHTSFAQ